MTGLLAGLLCLPALAADWPQGRLVDLTHAFSAETVYWPTEAGFVLAKGPAGTTAEGYYYAANRFEAAEHGGTHLDAPRHFHRGGDTADAVPLERLLGPAVLVDASAQCAKTPDYRVTVSDLYAWERAHGKLPKGAIVLLRTGWGKRWPRRKDYLGTDERGAEAARKLRFPGLHPDAAKWLAVERKIRAVGIDTASIDHGPSKRFEAHVALASRGVPVFENLASLDELPASGFSVVALPMKIAGGSGGPLRAVAIVP